MGSDGGGSSGNEQHTSVDATRREKKTCHRHTPEQIERLEACFIDCPHPDEIQRQELCRELNLEADQVKFWFQNKRTQSKAQEERSANLILRGENERIRCENEAMLEALKSVICPGCGGPPFGMHERNHNVQKLRLENAFLQEQRECMVSDICMGKPIQPTMVDSKASGQGQQIFDTRISYGTNSTNIFQQSSSSGPPTCENIQPQPLSERDIAQLSETAAVAVEELKRLFFTEEAFWVQSSIDGTYVIDQQSYEKFSHATRHFRSLSARIESSKDVAVVPIEATKLVEMCLDSEKWKELFPTIVSKAKTIHVLGSDKENSNVLQVIWEQLHILSPLVPARDFMIVRCCQKIDEGTWIVADVSHSIVNFDQVNASCFKRPSGCLIQTLPNAHSKVTWIEHVEVDEKSEAHKMYKELLRGGSGYSAKRWIVTLERMCERMTLSSILTIPPNDWSEVIKTGEGRRSVMKLGARMTKSFNEMLSMSGKVDFPQHSKCGVRISVRLNTEPGQPSGLVVCAASCLSVPITPLQVFNRLRNFVNRQEWDVLSYGRLVAEIARVYTGTSETNCVTLLQPEKTENAGIFMALDSDKNDLAIVQDCYMDDLGGMIVYAPIDTTTMKIAVSGEVDPFNIPILPSGFTIASNGRRSMSAPDAENGGHYGRDDGGTLLTVAFQILLSGLEAKGRELNEKSVDAVNGLISSTVQRIKVMLNGSSCE
ncbi:unnamed protein product [Microthlaspi erraticum]|uniref:Homeobox domain-containing protein n=1 Tax=Microthlaspi erraticum TaxID=1685480 RepID=A0A6D2IQS0_9BRAS|nr:unnamed protein product [Microthlaspi erraticum]